MTDRKARHARPRKLHVGPLFAFEAALAQLHAGREMHAASTEQRGGAKRPGFARRLAGRMLITFLAAFAIGGVGTQLGIMPAHAATVPGGASAWQPGAQTAVDDQAACDAAGLADPAMRYDIRFYLVTDRRWSWAYDDCNPDGTI